MEMIERVARVIDPVRWSHWDAYLARDPEQTAHTAASYCADSWRSARFAIAAMREPTEAMVKAAPSLVQLGAFRATVARNTWDAMIEAALSPEAGTAQMTGFLTTLTLEQRKMAFSYLGDDHHGSPHALPALAPEPFAAVDEGTREAAPGAKP